MAHSDHGIVKDKLAEEQPRDKRRAQTVHKTDQKGPPSRDPELNDDGKTADSGLTSDDSPSG